MKKIIALALSLALAPALSLAGPPAAKQAGIEAKDYKWNAQEGEKIEALKLKGNAKEGKEGYEVCGACHLPSGAGRPDGTFPQLAGQHTTGADQANGRHSCRSCVITPPCIRSPKS